MFKKIIFSLFLVFLFIILGQNAFAQESSDINVYFFWSESCRHCAEEKPFLERLEEKYPEVKIHDFKVEESRDNIDLLKEIAQELNVNVRGVPFTVIGEHYFIGWYNEETTGAAIEDAVRCAQDNACRDVGGEMLVLHDQNNPQNENEREFGGEGESSIPQTLNIPFFGKIETKNFSLPILTIILGTLDGFNPCAMWALLFLISLLLGMKNRKRMWILGSAFIVASASVYFIFMAAWLNFILFIGLVIWVRILIGTVALLAGGYNLKEYFTNPEVVCKVTGTEKRKKIFEKIKNITHQKSFYLALGGIILLAFAVNLVELICSAGLPAIYTQVLVLSNLARWQYYAYILLYIFFFMLDDLLVFFIAMTTLRMTGITTKYARYSHLIGGILMLIIGLLLIFRPGWLMFG